MTNKVDGELVGLIIASLIFIFWMGYYSYLSWFEPGKFKKMAEKSLPLYGNSVAMKEWISSEPFMWIARIATAISVGVCVFVFIMSLRTLILLI